MRSVVVWPLPCMTTSSVRENRRGARIQAVFVHSQPLLGPSDGHLDGMVCAIGLRVVRKDGKGLG